MTYDQFQKLIWDTPINEWHREESDKFFTCCRDLNVRIQVGEIDFEEKFEEKWHEDLPDPVGRKFQVSLYYGASFIEKIYFVLLDGARVGIPIPRLGNPLTIGAMQNKIAQIINHDVDSYQSYLERLKITITS